MVSKFSIRVSRRLQKMSVNGSSVRLFLTQRYEFDNVFDFFTHLDGFRQEHKLGNLQIRAVRVGSSCFIWSLIDNVPLGMSSLQYLRWENTLLSKYHFEN